MGGLIEPAELAEPSHAENFQNFEKVGLGPREGVSLSPQG
jgi:hypothetical protein